MKALRRVRKELRKVTKRATKSREKSCDKSHVRVRVMVMGLGFTVSVRVRVKVGLRLGLMRWWAVFLVFKELSLFIKNNNTKHNNPGNKESGWAPG